MKNLKDFFRKVAAFFENLKKGLQKQLGNRLNLLANAAIFFGLILSVGSSLFLGYCDEPGWIVPTLIFIGYLLIFLGCFLKVIDLDGGWGGDWGGNRPISPGPIAPDDKNDLIEEIIRKSREKLKDEKKPPALV